MTLDKFLKRPLKTRSLATKFISKLLSEENCVSDSISKLYENKERFHEIIEATYEFKKYDRSSFSLYIWVGMTEFLTKAIKSAKPFEVEDFLQGVYFNNFFFWRYGEACILTLSRLSHQKTCACDNGFKFDSLGRYVLYIVEILKWMLVYISDYSEKEEEIWRLHALCKRVMTNDTRTPGKIKSQISSCLQQCEKIKKRGEVTNDVVKKVSRKDIIKEVTTDLPGELCITGPRHNNDFVDFRKIQVYPTAEELFCNLKPFLPNEIFDTDDFIKNPVDKYLDRHFRLLREDATGNFRSAIQSFKGEISKLNPDQTILKMVNDNFFGFVHLYRNVSLKLGIHLYKGLSVKVEFDNPGFFEKKKRDKRKKNQNLNFWELHRSKLLNYGAIVCLFLKENNSEEYTFYVGTVIKGKTIEKNKVHVMLQMIESESLEESLLKNPEENSNGEIILMEVRGHFFTTSASILSCLKNHCTTSIPLLEDIGILPGDGSTQIPPYLRSTSIDLSSICLTESKSDFKIELLPDDIIDAEQILVREIGKKDVKLDDSQVKAFASAICRPLALIQGPPGTGKSYIGVEIVRFLLNNKFGMNEPDEGVYPILCICYTNHALDQFLVDLIDTGVSKNDIIRIGRSKEPKLVGCQLESTPKTKLEGRTLYNCHKKMVDFQKSLKSNDIPEFDVEEFLMFEEEELYEAFTDAVAFFAEARGEDDLELFKVIEIWKDKKELKYLPQNVSIDEYPWNLGKNARNTLYSQWMKKYEDEMVSSKLNSLRTNCSKIVRKFNDVFRSRNLRAIKNSKIIGITTSGAAKHQDLIASLGPKIVICEEAGEVFEPHIIASLSESTEHLILIGDHLQLRPKLNDYFLSYEANKGYSADVSLFERLVKHSSDNLVTLTTQRRMRPCISSLIRNTIYPNLIDHTNVDNYPELRGLSSPLWFYDHNYKDSGGIDKLSSSHTNIEEAKIAVQLVRYFLLQNYTEEGDIAVITPYLGQLMLLKQELQKLKIRFVVSEKDEEELFKQNEDPESVDDIKDDTFETNTKEKQIMTTLGRNVRLTTIDNFQGEEATIVILSLVRCNESGKIGFLKSPNRTNVMLSRAKHGMVILGSSKTILKHHQKSMLGKVIKDLGKNDNLGNFIPLQCVLHKNRNDVACLSDLQNFTIDGGCGLSCEFRLDCGHSCKRTCHLNGSEHKLL